MKVLSVTCNNCGGPLEVPKKVRFVNCGYCSSRLEIRQSGGAVYSEVLEKIEQNTERIADDLEAIKAQNEIERLDREWQMGMDRYKARNQDGEYSVPNSAGSVIGGVIAIGFGIFWMGMASGIGAPGIFPLFGLVFIGVAFFGMVSGVSKSSAYQRAHDEYQSKRRKLMKKR